MVRIMDVLGTRLAGSFAFKDGTGVALGKTMVLPVCDSTRRFEERVVPGGAGNDTKYICYRDNLGVYAWSAIAGGAGAQGPAGVAGPTGATGPTGPAGSSGGGGGASLEDMFLLMGG